MNRLVNINRENYKTINWIYAYKILFKLHNRIVSQVEKKNYRNIRNIQRLLLKNFSVKLIASNKIFEIEDYKKFYLYKLNLKKSFPKRIDINNYIQFEKDLLLKDDNIYFRFLELLWIFALIPLNETISNSNSYNFRLYRNYTDILRGLTLNLKKPQFKWILIIKPSGFENLQNQKWLLQNLIIEKKFLLEIFNYKKPIKKNLKKSKYIKNLNKISLIKILKNYSIQNSNLFLSPLSKSKNLIKIDPYKFEIQSIFYYNNLLLIPCNTSNQLIFVYKWIFKFLKIRGLFIKKNRIWIINLNNGFSFLGWFLKKKKNNIIVSINDKNIRSHKLEIKKFLKSARFLSIDKTINIINKKIWNWQTHYSYASNLNKTWIEMNYYLFWRIWKWCKKKHKNKGSKWIYQRYWYKKGKREWVFHFNNQYLQSYKIQKQRINYIDASLNVCKMVNLKRVHQMIFEKSNIIDDYKNQEL